MSAQPGGLARPAVVSGAILGAVMVGCFVGCGLLPRSVMPPVDLSSAYVSPTHAPVVVDGQVTSRDEWAGAAKVPIKGLAGARASFLWSDDGLYGLLHGDWWLSGDPDESLCVSVAGDWGQKTRYVRLYLKEDRGGVSGSPQRTVKLARTSRVPFDPTPLPPVQVRFASTAGFAAQGMPWTAEFFLPWTSLASDGKPPRKLFVHVFLICGQRPYSFLKLERDPHPK